MIVNDPPAVWMISGRYGLGRVGGGGSGCGCGGFAQLMGWGGGVRVDSGIPHIAGL